MRPSDISTEPSVPNTPSTRLDGTKGRVVDLWWIQAPMLEPFGFIGCASWYTGVSGRWYRPRYESSIKNWCMAPWLPKAGWMDDTAKSKGDLCAWQIPHAIMCGQVAGGKCGSNWKYPRRMPTVGSWLCICSDPFANRVVGQKVALSKWVDLFVNNGYVWPVHQVMILSDFHNVISLAWSILVVMILSCLFLVTEPCRSQLLRSADASSISISKPCCSQLSRSASAWLSWSSDIVALIAMPSNGERLYASEEKTWQINTGQVIQLLVNRDQSLPRIVHGLRPTITMSWPTCARAQMGRKSTSDKKKILNVKTIRVKLIRINLGNEDNDSDNNDDSKDEDDG